MKQADLELVLEIVGRRTGHCLCGHSESCGVCDGTADSTRRDIANALIKEFTPKIEDPKGSPALIPKQWGDRRW